MLSMERRTVPVVDWAVFVTPQTLVFLCVGPVISGYDVTRRDNFDHTLLEIC